MIYNIYTHTRQLGCVVRTSPPRTAGRCPDERTNRGIGWVKIHPTFHVGSRLIFYTQILFLNILSSFLGPSPSTTYLLLILYTPTACRRYQAPGGARLLCPAALAHGCHRGLLRGDLTAAQGKQREE